MNSRTVFNFFRFASLLMVLLAVALLSAIITMHFAIHGAEVKVPSLKGMTVAQARSETAGLGLNLDVDNRYYSGDVAAGHILTQSPAAGTVVRRAWQVRVAESLGPQQVDVPDTVGANERVAELELRRAGLEVNAPAYLPDANVPEGTVLAQDPPAHAQDIAQPAVTLLVAAPVEKGAGEDAGQHAGEQVGAQADGYVMPDLMGLLATTAIATMEKAGIKTTVQFVDVPVAPVGTGNAPIAAPVKPGAVFAQTPAAGARIDQTITVELTAAR